MMTDSKAQTQRGREEPFMRQFSVFLPNRVGQLAELLGKLAADKVEVVGVCVLDSADWAVVRLIFPDPDKAREALALHKFAFTECDAVAVVLTDADTLRKACTALLVAELNVQFAYPLLTQSDGQPVMVLHVDDEVLAARVLAQHGFRMIQHEEE
jgi:hypothetical protein